MAPEKLFSAAGEKEVTRAIVGEFAREFIDHVESDVIIVGGGPAGLMAGRDLCRAGKRVLI
ncbi:MAG: FAD-dependent monooxygenase, partial [Armatimonadota bacterium]